MKPFSIATPVRLSINLLLGFAAAIGIPCALAQRTPDTATLAEQYLLSAANQERGSRGLPLLHRDSQLAHAAAQHAGLMAAHGAISHQFPGEAELSARGANAGVAFSVIAENVGEAPSVITIHEMWMNSEHHRDNLLDPSVDSIGVSVMKRGQELFAVEDFAKIVRSVNLEAQESAIAALVSQQGRMKLVSNPDSISAARQTCSMSTGYAGAHKPWFVMRFSSGALTQIPDRLKTELASGRYHQAVVGACAADRQGAFTSYNFAVLLYP